MTLIERAEELEREAREVEGDSDNPLRVAAANVLWERAAALRTRAADTGSGERKHP